MNVALEAVLRSFALLLDVFLTVTGGRKSKPVWYAAMIVSAILVALLLAFTRVIA